MIMQTWNLGLILIISIAVLLVLVVVGNVLSRKFRPGCGVTQ